MTNCLGFWARKRSRREVLKALKNFSLFPLFFVSFLGTDNSKFCGQVQTKVAGGTRQNLENFAIKTFGITTKGGEEGRKKEKRTRLLAIALIAVRRYILNPGYNNNRGTFCLPNGLGT